MTLNLGFLCLHLLRAGISRLSYYAVRDPHSIKWEIKYILSTCLPRRKHALTVGFVDLSTATKDIESFSLPVLILKEKFLWFHAYLNAL